MTNMLRKSENFLAMMDLESKEKGVDSQMKELELKDRIFEGRANGLDLKEEYSCI